MLRVSGGSSRWRVSSCCAVLSSASCCAAAWCGRVSLWCVVLCCVCPVEPTALLLRRCVARGDEEHENSGERERQAMRSRWRPREFGLARGARKALARWQRTRGAMQRREGDARDRLSARRDQGDALDPNSVRRTPWGVAELQNCNSRAGRWTLLPGTCCQKLAEDHEDHKERETRGPEGLDKEMALRWAESQRAEEQRKEGHPPARSAPI